MTSPPSVSPLPPNPRRPKRERDAIAAPRCRQLLVIFLIAFFFGARTSRRSAVPAPGKHPAILAPLLLAIGAASCPRLAKSTLPCHSSASAVRHAESVAMATWRRQRQAPR
ncbi:hypothetical protein E2562_017039 [Oryza meyeriana var. granulata]|uniref:Uncharacterized protein n=1 Tax=Oryza meyeriana var. granulata TaxID=110450 RepID=A0A6G1F8V3_9ORYZ|nr:hypothetical protein E2562_017039 [Oryza meyeriana var. granulata]